MFDIITADMASSPDYPTQTFKDGEWKLASMQEKTSPEVKKKLKDSETKLLETLFIFAVGMIAFPWAWTESHNWHKENPDQEIPEGVIINHSVHDLFMDIMIVVGPLLLFALKDLKPDISNQERIDVVKLILNTALVRSAFVVLLGKTYYALSKAAQVTGDENNELNGPSMGQPTPDSAANIASTHKE